MTKEQIELAHAAINSAFWLGVFWVFTGMVVKIISAALIRSLHD